MEFFISLAVRCSDKPEWQFGTTVYAETYWDPDVDEPLFQEIAHYMCPEGYVFEIYQMENYNASINFGLIEDETGEINITCGPHGLWEPMEVPPCIRKILSL